MNRRDTLKGIALFAAGCAVPSQVLAAFRSVAEGKAEWTPKLVPAKHAALLAEIVDTIIPKTDSPGAKEAMVHVFVDLYAADCWPKPQQQVFLSGLDEVEARSAKAHQRAFAEIAPAERLALLVALEQEAFAAQTAPEQSFVRMLKTATVLGYFSSKPGATEAAEYVRSPGPFEGCVDLKPGQKVMAFN